MKSTTTSARSKTFQIAQETRRVLLKLDGKDVKASASWSDDESRRRIGVSDDAFQISAKPKR